MGINIVDTTLRDGEQKAGIALSVQDKVEIAKIISEMGVHQIEAGIPAMGGDEKISVSKIAALGLPSKIAAWNRMSTKDIDTSIECGVDIVHISSPVSDLQIKTKLEKDRKWVAENLKRTVIYALEKDCEVTVGLEDSSRADLNFLIQLCEMIFALGVKRVRYADTVGIMEPKELYSQIKKIRDKVPIDIEIHVHNDFGMAISNSFAAFKAGAKFADCTITGMGERAGNCDFLKFVKVIQELTGEKIYTGDFEDIIEKENEIKKILRLNW
ncbi:homocitrate synthase subunit alpha [Clostridium pasteurianum DSM 525 = ATCC 6013]|uniref:Homocitrate synthase subunit alpha n=2 Tax=Clostridium pasteurianum TaxID=1501 RepID=NIFVA_CLOPA|nr:homocitrate synthase subunit alpha [Clostridium pasteurianum]Q00853.1 RecName: Full=Homocitrate synthase subunit alpha [Clostridium pasteurianum]AAT37650.1 homocitrate synthase [Clostridium pasteurianum]AJA47522.1 homocitrate synthase subunit alpha [Clostridium pasteurianum DSM 525 = ATCC 6013]AJA51510.1 homocitrate synthase subunit alpha [Clostridium pasteurianum DSM 525 = ATCC 6013]AOZ74840.1 homocitrate synthase [Clostridium pasteurianum DSM 525 = ATCC 6013]AOZ78636.1 homocitrate syntha